MGIKGRVYLVGAGPGDPSLITLKGVQVLRQADVVLYDYLVHPSLFQHCSGTAKILCVGKKKGAHSKQQFEINRLLLKHAKMGLIVVRLKGGDPCVFGRGGEEMQYLKKHLIPFEVIPGVSAALSVPVLAGIPVTHRQLSRSLAVITGTTKESKQDLNIPNVDTLIVLMGVSHLAEIARKISDADGYSPSTPAALIYKGSTAEEKIILGDLATIAEKKKAANLTPP
ncbi:MAG: uroporphyrin-III C-methyltransferase, partial [Candidatus Marinamargulisbacteria bacterium]